MHQSKLAVGRRAKLLKEMNNPLNVRGKKVNNPKAAKLQALQHSHNHNDARAGILILWLFFASWMASWFCTFCTGKKTNTKGRVKERTTTKKTFEICGCNILKIALSVALRFPVSQAACLSEKKTEGMNCIT